jgi:hypothetical protein
MLKKILLAVAGTAAALGFSSAVLADPPHWAPAHGWRAQHDYRAHYEHYRPRYVYGYAPRPVYVMPAPRIVYTPAPPVVYAPAPVYHPAPVYGEPSVSIRLNFPL